MQENGAGLVLFSQAARLLLWENTLRRVSTHSKEQREYRDFVLILSIWPHSKGNKSTEAHIKRSTG